MGIKKFCISMIAFFIIFIHGFASAQDTLDKVGIDIIQKKKATVVLEHLKHVQEYELKCTDCHHKFDAKVDEEPKPCIECHDFSEKKMIDNRRVDLIQTTIMKNVYHEMCNECHDKLQRTGKPFPKKCSVCHPIRIE